MRARVAAKEKALEEQAEKRKKKKEEEVANKMAAEEEERRTRIAEAEAVVNVQADQVQVCVHVLSCVCLWV